ncbi:hypothetical protein ACJJTC_013887 [Scirpophaga incertulas]
MESHPLNLAHRQHRRADAHLLKKNYDEAIQCHHNAAELLLDAMKCTNSSVALESITLQHSYHLKQKDLIKIKKEQHARVMKAMEEMKCLGKDPFVNSNDNDSDVQVAIYRTINETDSLLGMLFTKKDNTEPVLRDVSRGITKEKTQQMVTEELQTLNQHLHSHVEKLVFQIEVLKDENTLLKEKVNYLEKERTKYLTLVDNLDHKNNTDVSDKLSKDFSKKIPVVQKNIDGKSTPPPHFFSPEK